MGINTLAISILKTKQANYLISLVIRVLKYSQVQLYNSLTEKDNKTKLTSLSYLA